MLKGIKCKLKYQRNIYINKGEFKSKKELQPKLLQLLYILLH